MGEAPGGPTGLVFDIQAHSVHDGPGTRTTVFLGGCPFQCQWCCNPEGLATAPTVLFREGRCTACGACAEACSRGAITFDAQGHRSMDRSLCAGCSTLDCVATCYHEGLVVSGRRYTVGQLEALFQRDRQFWGSRGGVTFSGGEPLLQRDFMLPLLRRCRALGIHTCVETTASLPTDWFLEAASLLDWLFVDLKHLDPGAHRAGTGASNALTLKNLQLLAASDLPCFVVVRIPVIPGWNDSETNLRATARFVRDCGLEVINLLPFHRLGESKWRQMGREYPYAGQKSLERGALEPYAAWIREEGVTCYTGWETPF